MWSIIWQMAGVEQKTFLKGLIMNDVADIGSDKSRDEMMVQQGKIVWVKGPRLMTNH